ncbi:MAG: glycosyltransferase family 4 protein [Pirellulales bacterium]|nr:glycosyltransferase family 4 protein [Pirellulales bacterium]
MPHSAKKNRILVVVLYPLGGIRTYLLHNFITLKDSGYEFTFVAPRGEAFESFKQDTCDWPGVEYVDASIHNGHCRLRQALRQTLKTSRFSLIHSQGLRAGVEVEITNYFARIPHLLTLHDTRHESEFIGVSGKFKKQIVSFFSSRIDVIIPVSHDCKSNHLDFFPGWKKSRCSIHVIQNGVDVPRLLWQAEQHHARSLRAEFTWDSSIKVLGYFGRFMPEKGFLVLLDALRILASRGYADKLRLVAIRDPYGYRGEYMREVKNDETLSAMVCFVDPVPTIEPLLSQIDLLVMPSLREACPLLPMEAMVLGVPVVGSDAIGLREVLRETPSMTPPAGEPAALANAIEQAIRLPCKQQAELFAPVAQTRFDNQVAANNLLELYSRVAIECV